MKCVFASFPKDAESESLLRPVEICIESQSLSPIVGFPRQTASAADPCVIVDEAGEVENGNVEGKVYLP